jgi:hypothetical protein
VVADAKLTESELAEAFFTALDLFEDFSGDGAAVFDT